jgi:restriction endonuclease S subunit
MRDGWVETSLEEIAEVIMGQSPDGKSYNQAGEGLPFMQGSAEFGEHLPTPEKWCSDPKKIAEVGDLLLSVRAPVGDTNFADQRIAVGRGLSVIRANSKSLTEFIRFVIQSNVAEMIASSGSGMFASITGKNLKEFKVLLPPLPEQKRIVDLISSVDSYIEALQQQLENVKKSRNAVLHELLTEGGDNWVETTLGETADLVRGPFGGSLKKEIFVQEGFAVYEQQHAIYGDFSNIRYRISTKKFDEMKRFSLLPGDLIMSCSGTMGKVRIVPEEAAPGIINQALLKIKPRSNLSGAFLFLWMQSDDFIRQIEMNSGGGALQNVSSVKMLKAIKLAVPELAIQDRVIKIISTIDEVKIKTELAIGAAKKLRSGLLSDLLNGEHEIPSNYDKVMGAA